MNKQRLIDVSYALLRFVTGLLMSMHGAQKLFGMFGGLPPQAPPITVGSQMWFGGLIELAAILVAIGLFTRPLAFLLSGTMAVAYFQFHQPGGALPIQNGGEPAAIYCFIFLFIAAYGCGALGLDSLLFKKKESTPAQS